MKLAVLGATGRTGREVVRRALELGHHAVGVTRGPTFELDRLAWVPGSVLDPAVLDRAIEGADAVVIALGPSHGGPVDVCSRATAEAIEACRRREVRRLVVLTGAMIGLPPTKLDVLMRAIRAIYRGLRPREAEDRERQEAAVRGSGLDWTLVRPPRMTDGPATDGAVDEEAAVDRSSAVSRKTVARVIVEAATSSRWSGRAVVVVDA